MMTIFGLPFTQKFNSQVATVVFPIIIVKVTENSLKLINTCFKRFGHHQVTLDSASSITIILNNNLSASVGNESTLIAVTPSVTALCIPIMRNYWIHPSRPVIS